MAKNTPLSKIEFWEPEVIILWGCNPSLQYERDWFLSLLRPSWIKEVNWFDQDESVAFKMSRNSLVILVESARDLLNNKMAQKELDLFYECRKQRIDGLKKISNFIIWHISDESGQDGDDFYPNISKTIPILREFPYKRFDKLGNIKNMPLGPSRWALRNNPWLISSLRKFSWSFMGTCWKNSSRKHAVDCFKSNIPNGTSYLGGSFGQGVKQSEYINIMINSSFTLCPEGNRHFETIRFYESLELGSIPLLIKGSEIYLDIFQEKFPVPIFRSWEESAIFANSMIKLPEELNQLQLKCFKWWLNSKHYFSSKIDSYKN